MRDRFRGCEASIGSRGGSPCRRRWRLWVKFEDGWRLDGRRHELDDILDDEHDAARFGEEDEGRQVEEEAQDGGARADDDRLNHHHPADDYVDNHHDSPYDHHSRAPSAGAAPEPVRVGLLRSDAG